MTFTTLCYIEKGDSYLMLHRIKKEHDINKDKWIGVGGHFETGESPDDCLLRETFEETGLTLTSYQFRGILTFLCDDITDYYICVYTADGYTGNLKECKEGTLEWVSKKDIINLDLWEGDLIFFKLLEENAPFFSLKVSYINNVLKEAVLNGQPMELLDLVDEYGIPTGKVRERSLVHLSGNLHRTSHVWITRSNTKSGFDVLLQKRAAGKDSYPGCYDISSAGHIPAGCDYLESALRELEEELGITVSAEELTLIAYHEGNTQDTFYNRPFLNHEYSAIYLLIKDIPLSSLTLQQEEIESVLWMDYAECLAAIKSATWNHCIYPDEFELLGRQYFRFNSSFPS